MTLKLNERYPGRFNNPSAGYPGGSFKNRTTPTAKDGSYLEKDWANDKEGFFQSLLSAAGITANGAVDAVGASQFFDALQALKQIQAGTAFTTAGSAGALTLAPTPAISAYSAPLRLRVKFSQASTGADTINVSGLGAKSLKQYDSTGAKVAAVFAVNQLADVEYDGTDMVVLDPLPSGAVQATESAAGVAKVATTPIATAGTNDTDMMTPLKTKLAIAAQASSPVQATESAAGVAKVATQALTNAGVDDATIVTPKKLFAAQQAALNLKMNLTGDGAVPRLGAVSVNSGPASLYPNQQGAYLFWNETGDGRASLVNNQGGGTGGFVFRNVNNANTVETGNVTIDGSGSLSSTGNITAAGNIYAANGAAALQNDGNVNGSVWGGWLGDYLVGNFLQPSNLMTNYASNGTGTVGTYALMTNRSGVGLNPGSVVNGASLTYANTEDVVGNGGAAGGSWRCMGYAKASSSDQGTTLFMRYA